MSGERGDQARAAFAKASAPRDEDRGLRRVNAVFEVLGESLDVSVGWTPDGLPRATALVPAPMMPEIDRQRRVQRALEVAVMDGLIVESQRRVRNPAFDKGGEKTTTEIVFRRPQTEDEAGACAAGIRDVLRRRGLLPAAGERHGDGR